MSALGSEAKAPSRHTRRSFLAAAAATTWTAQSWARIPGANDRVRVGIIGGARGAKDLVAQLAAEHRTGARVQLTASSSMDGALDLATGWGLNIRDHWQEVATAKDLDGILVAAPLRHRATVALAAIEAGKDIYLLTPMTQQVTQAAALRDAAHRGHRIVQVACTQCAQPPWNDARKRIASGALGPLRAAFIRYAAGSATRSLAHHLHDALAPFIYATGLASPSSIMAIGGRSDGDPSKEPEGLLLRAQYPRPGTSPTQLTASTSPALDSRATLRGETEHLTIQSAPNAPERSLLGEWLTAIRSRGNVRCTPTLAHQIQHTTELALQSYAQGRTLRVG